MLPMIMMESLPSSFDQRAQSNISAIIYTLVHGWQFFFQISMILASLAMFRLQAALERPAWCPLVSDGGYEPAAASYAEPRDTVIQ